MNCPHQYVGVFTSGPCAECRELTQLRADLAKSEKEAKRCADGWDALQAKLAAAIRSGAEIVAQRDTALGLCKQREQELAKVTAERVKDRERDTATMQTLLAIASDDLDAERAAHKKTLTELAKTQHERETAAQYGESTRAELATALERVKELERENTELQTFRTVFSKEHVRG